MVETEPRRTRRRRDDEAGLHADDTSELYRRNLIARQTTNKKERKENNERNNKEKKEDNERNNKGKKENDEKKVKTNWGKLALGQDMWKQLKRVSIPVFNRDKKSYQSWKACSMTCINQASTTAEYKLLLLRSSLKGEAFKVVESLGNSVTAYQPAKEGLERKYGGVRRHIAINLEELDIFCPICSGNVRDVEKLTDLLDIIVVNLTEARKEELGNGCLNIAVQKMMAV